MTDNLMIIKPTPAERLIWERIKPKKSGGLIRQGSADRPYELPPCYYGPRDKTNPHHWDCKTKGGPDAEWWVYMMEGAHRVLDVGCGFGFPSFYLASHGFEVVGVDPSPSEIATAEQYRQKEGPSLPLKYEVIEQTRLPFNDNTFDGATFSGSLATATDPETLVNEVIRVLKPGSRVAFDEEDRALEPRSHPVAEHMKIVVIDELPYLWVESRTCEPYLDRRYMIRLSKDFRINADLQCQPAAGAVLPAVELDKTELTLEEVLGYAVDAEYGEARGYDAESLKEFVERMGFGDLKFWARNNGLRFAEQLQTAGILDQMPNDITAVLRALARSVPPLASPTTLVSCVSPQ